MTPCPRTLAPDDTTMSLHPFWVLVHMCEVLFGILMEFPSGSHGFTSHSFKYLQAQVVQSGARVRERGNKITYAYFWPPTSRTLAPDCSTMSLAPFLGLLNIRHNVHGWLSKSRTPVGIYGSIPGTSAWPCPGPINPRPKMPGDMLGYSSSIPATLLKKIGLFTRSLFWHLAKSPVLSN